MSFFLTRVKLSMVLPAFSVAILAVYFTWYKFVKEKAKSDDDEVGTIVEEDRNESSDDEAGTIVEEDRNESSDDEARTIIVEEDSTESSDDEARTIVEEDSTESENDEAGTVVDEESAVESGENPVQTERDSSNMIRLLDDCIEEFSLLMASENQRTTDETIVSSDSEVLEFCRFMIQNMDAAIKTLNLEDKTAEEIQREVLFVDFGDLPLPMMSEDLPTKMKVLVNLYRHFIPGRRLREKVESLHPSDRDGYDLREYNIGIVALGVENFMSAATQFLEEEAVARDIIYVVSVGSGDGTVERNIIAEYRRRYGQDLPIILVDSDPKFENVVDFGTVDQLVETCSHVVGNCVALINWPDPVDYELLFSSGRERCDQQQSNESYDTQAIRLLQPEAVLVVYECVGSSGSNRLRFLLSDNLFQDQTLPGDKLGMYNWLSRFYFRRGTTSSDLPDYWVAEIAHQNVWLEESGTFIYKMVKLKKANEEIEVPKWVLEL